MQRTASYATLCVWRFSLTVRAAHGLSGHFQKGLSMGREFGTTFSYDVPRVLAFYQDVLDDDGNSLGWRTVAWGLRRKDGWTVSFGVDDPPSIRLWQNVEDALLEMDAYIDTPEPRPRFEHMPPPPPMLADASPADMTMDD